MKFATPHLLAVAWRQNYSLVVFLAELFFTYKLYLCPAVLSLFTWRSSLCLVYKLPQFIE
jgi:hypothetical protein